MFVTKQKEQMKMTEQEKRKNYILVINGKIKRFIAGD